MRFVYRTHEWLADHVSWIQYPKPQIRSVSGHAIGWRARWAHRPPMNRWLAVIAPMCIMLLPFVGVYLAIGWVIFLFAYFRRT